MATSSYSQNGEDVNIAYYLGKGAMTYLDVGCLWPVEHSNTYLFYERGGAGLCIDANPDVAEQWAQVRPRDQFVNSGVAAQPGVLRYHMYGNPVFNTFSEEQVARVAAKAARRPGTGRVLREVREVPVAPLRDLVRRSGLLERVDRLDLLSLDVEGLEFDVLSSYDFVLRPRLVVTEHIARHDDLRTLHEVPVVRLLEQRGYSVAGFTGHDLYLLDAERG